MRKRTRILVAAGAAITLLPLSPQRGEAQTVQRVLFNDSNFSSFTATSNFKTYTDTSKNKCLNAPVSSGQTLTIKSGSTQADREDARLSADCSIFESDWGSFTPKPGQLWHAVARIKISNVLNNSEFALAPGPLVPIFGAFRGRLKIHSWDDDDPLKECNQDIMVETPVAIELHNFCVLPDFTNTVKVAIRARQQDTGVKTQGVTSPIPIIRSRGSGTVHLEHLKVEVIGL